MEIVDAFFVGRSEIPLFNIKIILRKTATLTASGEQFPGV